MKDISLWRSLGVNMLVSTVLFAVFFLLLWLVELLFPSVTLLHFNDFAWCVGIPASVIGVSYVLTIRNPNNYTGFYPGIVMSALLAWQCFLQGNYDLTILYVLVFIPFQIKSVITWMRKESADESEDSKPAFLSRRAQLLSALFFVVVTAADYLLATYVLQHNSLGEAVGIKLFGALMIASSILSNFWLIYRKTDAWLYWVIYSASGIVFFILAGNAFSVLLFCFFLVINALAGIAWLKA